MSLECMQNGRWSLSPWRPILKLLYLPSDGETSISRAPNAVDVRVSEKMLAAAIKLLKKRELGDPDSPDGPRAASMDRAQFLLASEYKRVKKEEPKEDKGPKVDIQYSADFFGGLYDQ